MRIRFNKVVIPFAAGFAVTFAALFPLLRPVEASRPQAESSDAMATVLESPTESYVHRLTDNQFDRSIRTGLDWLMRHQFSEGVWDTRHFQITCSGRICEHRGNGQHDVGVTALSMLAYVRSGYLTNPEVGPSYEAVVRRGMEWLAAQQDSRGRFVAEGSTREMYIQALATLAAIETFAHFGEIEYRRIASKGLRYLLLARNPGSGWRYHYRDGRNDTSVTGWCMEAVDAALTNGFDVDPVLLVEVNEWLDSVTDPRYFRVGYHKVGTGSAYERDVNEHFAQNETLTAVGLKIRRFVGESAQSLPARMGVSLLLTDLPVRTETSRDFYYWYHGTGALAGHASVSAEDWTAWRESLGRVLFALQNDETSCANGSWDAVGKWSTPGGRVYSTAINLLSLIEAR